MYNNVITLTGFTWYGGHPETPGYLYVEDAHDDERDDVHGNGEEQLEGGLARIRPRG